MNEKITLVMFFSFITTGIALIFLASSISDEYGIDQNHSFFKQEFDPKLKKIFVFGSSHVGALNSTLISNNISNNYQNYEFYNLAVNADTPKGRSSVLTEIISLEPSIIFYGISYRDLTCNCNLEEKEDLPAIHFNLILDIFDPENKLKLKNIDPKSVTLRMIYGKLNEILNINTGKSDVHYSGSPFFTPTPGKIMNQNELKRNAVYAQASILTVDGSSSNEQVLYLKKIIEELQKNNIQIVFFTTPLSSEYTSLLSSNTQDNFQEVLDELKIEFGLDVYDFTNRYGDLSIWSDSAHVAYNSKSTIYTTDILNMIIFEIKK